jgi:hypothetical protein
MQKDLGLSNIVLGLAFSAFNYAYAPFHLLLALFAMVIRIPYPRTPN